MNEDYVPLLTILTRSGEKMEPNHLSDEATNKREKLHETLVILTPLPFSQNETKANLSNCAMRL